MKQRKLKPVKPSLKEPAQSPVFPQTPHRTRPGATAANANPKKRDNIFSKSRDVREDRGQRQIKTTRNTQTGSRGR